MRNILIIMALMAVTLMLVSCGAKNKTGLSNDPYYSSFEEVKAASAKDGRPILIKFYADWCTWCKTLDTVVLIDQKAINFFSSEVNLVRIDTEVDTALAKEYKISGLPTCVLTDNKGQEIDRIIGYMETDEFLQKIVDYQNGIGTLDDLLKKAEANPERSLFLEIAEKYKYRGGTEQAKNWYQKVIDNGTPLDSLSGEGRMSLADMMLRDENYTESIEAYSNIMEDFKGQWFAQDSEIWLAIVYKKLGDTTKAIGCFEQYIKNYPESEDVVYAQKQIDKLKGVESGT